MTNPILSVKNLTINAPTATLVHDLSFEVMAGKTLAIVGESGSGKSISTLALFGLLPKNLRVSGQAVLGGLALPLPHSQDKASEAVFRQVRGSGLGMVFQEPMTALNPLHKVGKQLGESLGLIGIPKAAQKNNMLELLTQVNLTDESLLYRYPHELSGGQRQRVMIAMALAQDPKVLVADEPTTALDVSLRHGVLQLLDKLKAARDMGLILISHDLNLVKKYSDNIIVMQQGKVVEYGKTDEIFANPSADYTKSLIYQDYGKPLDVQNSDTVLQVQQMSVKYPAHKNWLGQVNAWFAALQPIDTTLMAGQSLGIVGESGSGKSTLALALTRLITHHAQVSGVANLVRATNTKDILTLPKGELVALRRDVQMVFQDPFASLNPRFTVVQIVAEGLAVQGVPETERQARVSEMLSVVGLGDEYLHRYPHELSGGQRQRIALARALVLRPRLILLDEPTSALDSNTQVAMVALLRQIQAEFGVSYILISHDIAVVRALCQDILVLKDGVCVEQGNSEQLFTSPKHAYTKALVASVMNL
ncbi:MAG: dipeptide ABC transporter ATP-binding protein [Moraxella sp.]|nr:dipeptide ABC transporter ATP-binding protein [Moraxella sp.]